MSRSLRTTTHPRAAAELSAIRADLSRHRVVFDRLKRVAGVPRGHVERIESTYAAIEVMLERLERGIG